MAVPADFAYLRHLVDADVVQGPVLEIGSRRWQGDESNTEHVCRRAGLEWEGADIVAGPGVDFLLDLLDSDAVDSVRRQWHSVLLFNLLEHVYDPAEALRNAMKLVAPGGVCATAGPVVCQLHDYPRDYWRPLPDFFLEFAERHGYEAPMAHARWLTEGKIIPVDEIADGDQKLLPSLNAARVVWGRARTARSRLVHKVFNTYGRVTEFPMSGLGMTLRKPLDDGGKLVP